MKIAIETSFGKGEATKEAPGDSWVVNLPDRSFNYYGSVPELKTFIKRLTPSAVFTENNDE